MTSYGTPSRGGAFNTWEDWTNLILGLWLADRLPLDSPVQRRDSRGLERLDLWRNRCGARRFGSVSGAEVGGVD
jgi:hypothetical protein